jgi:hypothetical protein
MRSQTTRLQLALTSSHKRFALHHLRACQPFGDLQLALALLESLYQVFEREGFEAECAFSERSSAWSGLPSRSRK